MELPQKRFHGWNIVGACFVISLLVGGLISQLPLMYALNIGKELEWSDTALNWAFGAVMAPMFVAALLIGLLVDRVGSKKLMLVGGLVAGSGMILFASIWNVWSFAFISIFIMAGGSAVSGIPVDVLLLRWFRRRRGLAIAVVFAGASVGSGIFWLGNSYLGMISHWRMAAVLLGVVGLAVAVPLVRRAIKDRPSEMGLLPDGIESEEELTAEQIGHSLKEALRTKSFWLITASLFLANAVLMPLQVHSTFYLTDVALHAPSTVAMLDKIGTVLAVPGTILLGLIADRWNARKAFVLAMALVVVGILPFFASAHLFLAALFVLLYGISSKSLFVLCPLIIADSHGLERFGIICAVVSLLSALGGLVGVPLAALAPSDPRLLYALFIPLALLSAYCIYKARPLSRRKIEEESA